MSEIKTDEDEKSLSSPDEENDSDKYSCSKSKLSSAKTAASEETYDNNNSGIIEVYKDNFNKELKHLCSLLNEYNYIGMDTEFPGIVYSLSSLTDDFYYKTTKLNVDYLKLIQLGITLSNDKGEYPKPFHTWQFNFQFDITKDKSSQSSMKLLITSGINFNKLKTNGINHKVFFKQFKRSGLVLNPRINWISFHGSYDFAYLLSNLCDGSLPETEKDFTKDLQLFFPNHYDIRILVKEKENLQGSLNKLASYLDVVREGKIHQAGSDSMVTIDVFWKLINEGFISEEKLIENKNILFGICDGKDNEETINYIKFNNGYNSNNYINNINQKFIENNMIYLPYGRNIYNMNMNYCFPQYMTNGLNNGFNNFRVMNYNNILQYC